MIVVTGASSGIGQAVARELARRGESLILTGRDSSALSALGEELSRKGNLMVIWTVADLATSQGFEALWSFIVASGQPLAGLVHCAGEGWVGPYVEMPEPDVTRMLQLLVTTPMLMTQRALRVWGDETEGRILVISSTAAYQAGPGASVYYACKSALHRWAVALQQELRGSPTSLTLACPGAVKSQFSTRAGKQTLAWARTPKAVARTIVKAWEKGVWRVVPGWENRWLLALTRWLPERPMAALVARSQVPDRN